MNHFHITVFFFKYDVELLKTWNRGERERERETSREGGGGVDVKKLYLGRVIIFHF